MLISSTVKKLETLPSAANIAPIWCSLTRLSPSSPVEAPAIVWLSVIGNLQLALRHPENVGASRQMVEEFARALLGKLFLEGVLTPDQMNVAFRDFV